LREIVSESIPKIVVRIVSVDAIVATAASHVVVTLKAMDVVVTRVPVELITRVIAGQVVVVGSCHDEVGPDSAAKVIAPFLPGDMVIASLTVKNISLIGSGEEIVVIGS